MYGKFNVTEVLLYIITKGDAHMAFSMKEAPIES
jgi:hypothetical protein